MGINKGSGRREAVAEAEGHSCPWHQGLNIWPSNILFMPLKYFLFYDGIDKRVSGGGVVP